MKTSKPVHRAPKMELHILSPDTRQGFPAGQFYRTAELGSAAPFLCAHQGRSMNPTLCALDFLEVTPYNHRPIRTGDVVAFSPPDGQDLIAHRVVAIKEGRLRTRGDNNATADSHWLEPGHLLGQVTGAWRGSRHRRVAGGLAGRGVAWWGRQRKRLDRACSPVLHPLYDTLARSGLLRRLCPGRLAPRVVVFQVDGRPCARLLLGRSTIGHYDSVRQRWQIRRPYRLIVNVKALPAPRLAATAETGSKQGEAGACAAPQPQRFES